jgi:hypothetical protein
MTGERLPEILAATIERKDGLPCGACGGRHVESMNELENGEPACTCQCCHDALVEMIEADFPDLVTTRGGVRIVTQAAFDEAIRRMKGEIVSMEFDLGESLR